MSVSDRVSTVLQSARDAARAANRGADEVTVLAVAKTRSADEVRAAVNAGLTHVGENYLNEALPKIAALTDLPVCWHFIGAIQSNKTRLIAENFSWVHTVERIRIAERLASQRPAGLEPLNVCIQVNIDEQPSKAGATCDQVHDLAIGISRLPTLRLCGLMAIPAPQTDPREQSIVFRALRELRDTTTAETGLELPVLSMGMSADFRSAIAEGATHVRIGTALFGPRPPATQTSTDGTKQLKRRSE